MILRKIAFAAALIFAIGSVGLTAEFTKGQVTKVDVKQKKVTIKHEELKDLDMPAMTMVFVVADDAMLAQVAPGKSIEFTAERVNGRLTVTSIK